MIVVSPIMRRVLALAILAAIPLTLWHAIIDPIWQSWADSDETEARSLQLIADFRQTAATRPALEARFKEVEVRGKTLPGFVTGNTPALAAATLQSEIKRIIESKGGQVRSTQDLAATRERGAEKIGVRFDITTSLESLPKIVYEIEAHAPYLFIDNVEIRAPEDARPESYVADKPILIIRWDVYGYRAVGET
jgi:hypothetical protein